VLAPVLLALCISGIPMPGEATRWIDCEITYDLDSWAAFYKVSRGTGVILCNNGQRAAVELESRGGGFAFGSSQIRAGKGRFSKVRDITETFGRYGRADGSAGAGASAGAQVLFRPGMSLALAGTGDGVELGIAFGSFDISPR
jgi:hypothetical protein